MIWVQFAATALVIVLAGVHLARYPTAYNDHLTWGAILLLLLTRGPGVFSLDYLIDRSISRRSGTHTPL